MKAEREKGDLFLFCYDLSSACSSQSIFGLNSATFCLSGIMLKPLPAYCCSLEMIVLAKLWIKVYTGLGGYACDIFFFFEKDFLF